MWAACLTIFVCAVSGRIGGRYEYRDDVVAQQEAVLQRAPLLFNGRAFDLPEFRSRVLMPLVLRASGRLGVLAPREWFVVWRLITALLMFGTIMVVLPHGPWQLAAQGLLAFELVLSFNRPWEYPTDFPDVVFTLLFCALTLRRAWWPLLAVSLLAATNRESAAFAGVIWICAHGWSNTDARDPATPGRRRFHPEEIVRGVALSAVTYGFVVLLRAFFFSPGDVQRLQLLGLSHLPRDLRSFVMGPTPSAWPVLLVAGIVPLVMLTRAARDTQSPEHRRMVFSAVIVAGITLVFGISNELRVFLPAAAILIFANCHALSRDFQN